ncbi:glycosyltransferase [Pseudooceanicola sediminis]|uniref:Glycosyltransferase n=1 Tax=Pseudooceanicola sediminis TaxID=2211117 RepID=A0A399J4P5_9RHOB|nr:glycosyltransferase [Pseudooceanicola sediminis]KAA2315396.1 glycosyltransferase [Puniceibacterium sp. HSS470]RII40398.1 glycosyltransferase [Pseudooceanicola sediminis]|tara:strand:+ start:100704 stop:101957 length:1254 start_codon:yes stop_codon:yes gene_type:complete
MQPGSASLRFSVIVVSRGRPAALGLCLTGLSRLAYDAYEIIVVADPDGLAAVARSGLADEVKQVACDVANIAVARNLGVAAAAGEVIAFLDDDSVPEPGWLAHLAQAFARPEVAAAGGFVRARNGISHQFTAASVDRCAETRPVSVDAQEITCLTTEPGAGIKTEGTNMAFRRSVLAQLGGFDPAYRFYLEDADLNLRLAERGIVSAVVPLAEVHHHPAESATRRASGVARDLHEVGASTAVFLRRHCPAPERQAAIARLRARRRRSLVAQMVSGRLEPRDVGRLLAGFDAGLAEGMQRECPDLVPLPASAAAFRPFRSRRVGEPLVLAARWIGWRGKLEQAEQLAREGRPVTLFVFSPTTLYHRVRMTTFGVWVQSGGTFGKSLRSDKAITLWRFSSRVSRETGRIVRQRWNAPLG